MWSLTRIELFKIFRKPRTYIAFGAIAALIGLIQLALYADGETYLDFALQSLGGTFTIEGKKLNGYFVCYTILQTLLIHVPLLIALVAGDALAGEAALGTLRLTLTRPVGRRRLALASFLASVIYTLVLLLFMAILALFGSMLIFGTSDLLVFKSETIVLLSRNDVFWRYCWAFGFAALSMITVASLAFFLSSLAQNSIGPVIATMSIIVVLTILITMDIPLFRHLRPFLFINHMLNWKGFFDDPVDWREVGKSALVLLGHTALFLTAALEVFRRKQVLS